MLSGCAVRQPVLRIACVGDSLTYGHLVEYRERNSYPAQLQQLLGDGYLVENFGVNGHTVQRSGDYPYWDHAFFTESADFAPDIVLLMLGTNDAKDLNWQGVDAFASDYRALVTYFRELPENPQVYLMTPPSVYAPEDPRVSDFAKAQERLMQVAEAIRNLSLEEALPLIDVFAATAERPELFLEDGVHTNAEGAKIIAETACTSLIGPRP